MHGHTPAARYFSRLLALVTLMVALSEQAHAYIADDRWNRTATDTNTGSQGTPITLTWSFAPDGTTIPTLTDSNLIDFLDTNFGQDQAAAILRSGLGSQSLIRRLHVSPRFAALLTSMNQTTTAEPSPSSIVPAASWELAEMSASEESPLGPGRTHSLPISFPIIAR